MGSRSTASVSSERFLFGRGTKFSSVPKSSRCNTAPRKARPGRLTVPKMAAAEAVTSDRPTRPSGGPGDLPTSESGDPSSERRAEAFRLLAGVADKALALGRAEEAERLLATALLEVVEASRTGKHPSAFLVDTAARLAAKLAT